MAVDEPRQETQVTVMRITTRHVVERLVAASILLVVTASVSWAAAQYQGSPETYLRIVPRLAPGDTLSLAAGVYREGLPLHNTAGERGRPITISGPIHGPPAIFAAHEGRNTISIVDAHDLVIRNLVLEG